MTLEVNGILVAQSTAPGLFTAQPSDELSIGADTITAVGDYITPNSLEGTVKGVEVGTS